MAQSRARLERVKRACEPCRKRKVKCSGEQPTCSLCERLGQSCSYRPQYNFRLHKTNRARTITRERSSAPASGHDVLLNPCLEDVHEHLPLQPDVDLEDDSYLPSEALDSIIENYIQHIHLQPLPILPLSIVKDADQFRSHPELFHGMLAISNRYSSQPSDKHNKAARSLVFKALEISESIGLSVVQAACMLCLADYLDGSPQRASLTLGIGIQLAYSLKLLKAGNLANLTEKEDVACCCWSLFALERLFSIASGTGHNMIQESHLPRHPSPPESPPHVQAHVDANRESRNLSPDSPLDIGMTGCCLQLASAWGRVMRYAMEYREAQMTELPWMADSEYSRIQAQIQHFETIWPDEHRWANVGFMEQTREQVQEFQGYWSSWLFMQLGFHSSLALLNHPLFSLHLPPVCTKVPPSFADSTSNQARYHTKWIAYFVRLIVEKRIEVTDPFLAFTAAIAASIIYLTSRVDEQEAAERGRLNVELCYHFVNGMGVSMPVLADLARKLAALIQNYGSPIDTELIWPIIEYTKTMSTGSSDLRFRDTSGPESAGAASGWNDIPLRDLLTGGGPAFPPQASMPLALEQITFPTFAAEMPENMTLESL